MFKRQMANAKGRKNLRYKIINGKSTCNFKTVMYDDSFEIRTRRRSEEFKQKFCQQNSTMPYVCDDKA